MIAITTRSSINVNAGPERDTRRNLFLGPRYLIFARPEGNAGATGEPTKGSDEVRTEGLIKLVFMTWRPQPRCTHGSPEQTRFKIEWENRPSIGQTMETSERTSSTFGVILQTRSTIPGRKRIRRRKEGRGREARGVTGSALVAPQECSVRILRHEPDR